MSKNIAQDDISCSCSNIFDHYSIEHSRKCIITISDTQYWKFCNFIILFFKMNFSRNNRQDMVFTKIEETQKKIKQIIALNNFMTNSILFIITNRNK